MDKIVDTFVSSLHRQFDSIVRYWMNVTLCDITCVNLEHIFETLLVSPFKLQVDNRYVSLFGDDALWARFPLRLMKKYDCLVLRRVVAADANQFRVKTDNMYNIKYTSFRYNSYVDARLRRIVLFKSFVLCVKHMFEGVVDCKQQAAVYGCLGAEITSAVSKYLFKTHPLHKEIVSFVKQSVTAVKQK